MEVMHNVELFCLVPSFLHHQAMICTYFYNKFPVVKKSNLMWSQHDMCRHSLKIGGKGKYMLCLKLWSTNLCRKTLKKMSLIFCDRRTSVCVEHTGTPIAKNERSRTKSLVFSAKTLIFPVCTVYMCR